MKSNGVEANPVVAVWVGSEEDRGCYRRLDLQQFLCSSQSLLLRCARSMPLRVSVVVDVTCGALLRCQWSQFCSLVFMLFFLQ